MKIAFMGTPDFAVPSLQALVAAGHTVAPVVTQPDRPKGRGKKLAFSSVKECALSLSLPLLQPETARGEDFLASLKSYDPEVAVVAAYGLILPPAALAVPKYGCINVHASLLPQYRGAAPIHRAIINGETLTGITTMYMDEGLDTGDMILKKEIPISRTDTVGALHDRLAAAGAELLLQTLDLVAQGKAPRTPQTGPSTYASMLTQKDELLDWSEPAEKIYNRIRGLDPWPGARTYLEGKAVKIWGASIINERDQQAPPGQILGERKEGLWVNAGEDSLLITELQFQGAKRLSTAAYLRGHPTPTGRFEM